MITADQVKEAMINNGITAVDHHNCSFCGYMTRYIRDGENLFFDRGCDCGCGWENLEPRSYENAADWINMQSNPEAKARLAKSFGIVMEELGDEKTSP